MKVPSLRDRAGDIPFLAKGFFDRFCREHGRELEGFTPRALQTLAAHPWPGNVRELENALERTVLLATGTALTHKDLPDEVTASSRNIATTAFQEDVLPTPLLPLKVALEGPEREILLSALIQSHGCRKSTAEVLGINRTCLLYTSDAADE